MPSRASLLSLPGDRDTRQVLPHIRQPGVYAAASSSSSSTTIPQRSPPTYIRSTAKLYSLFLVEQENNGALEKFARIVDDVKPVSNPNWKKVAKVWNERVEATASPPSQSKNPSTTQMRRQGDDRHDRTAKRRRLTGQPLITAFVRTTSPSTVPSVRASFTLDALTQRSAAPPSDQAELDTLADGIHWQTRVDDTAVRVMNFRASNSRHELRLRLLDISHK
eukprot:g52790.t1